MTHVTPVPRARRSARRQAVLACAYGAYIAVFAAAVLALASLVASTGRAAVGAFAVAGVIAAAGGLLWALDAAAARRRPLAPVTRIAPAASQMFAQRRTIAR